MQSLSNQELESQTGTSRTSLETLRHRAHMVGVMAGSIGIRNTAHLVFNRLRGVEGQEEKPVTLRDRQFYYPLHATIGADDMCNFNEIARQGVYDLPEVIDKEIDGKPIIDLGGYIGIAAAYFASRYPNSEIVSIEPHERNFALLEANAEPYNGQIQPFHAAIAPEEGAVSLTAHGHSEYAYMSNRFSLEDSSGNSQIAAISPQDVLEDLGYPEEIGLLKVDIEGAEQELFASPSIDELLERTTIALIETHNQFVPGSLDAVLTATARHDMTPARINQHTVMYSRSLND